MSASATAAARSRSGTCGSPTARRRCSTASPSTCRRNEIFAIIGPAQSGKTSLLRCINRTIEFTAGARVERHRSRSTARTCSELQERLRAAAQGRHGGAAAGRAAAVASTTTSPSRRAPPACATRPTLDALVERCLRQAALWDEVKDRLDSLGTKLSGGQQQRLTIARALSHQPEILCLDEFSIAIDPVTTMRIEDVLKELKKEMTIILVTNLVQQARRLAEPHHVPLERRDRRDRTATRSSSPTTRQTGRPTTT